MPSICMCSGMDDAPEASMGSLAPLGGRTLIPAGVMDRGTRIYMTFYALSFVVVTVYSCIMLSDR